MMLSTPATLILICQIHSQLEKSKASVNNFLFVNVFQNQLILLNIRHHLLIYFYLPSLII